MAQQTKKDHINKHLKKPEGSVGNIIAQHMNEEYAELNQWAVRKLNIQKLDQVLEIGYGTGMAIQQIAQLASQGFVAGIDYSELMFHQAKVRNRESINAGRIDLRQADILDLPDFGVKFDKIIAVNNMMYWDRPYEALQQLACVLKPTGFIAIFWQRRPDYIASEEGQNELSWYLDVLRKAGFATTINYRPIYRLYSCLEAVDLTKVVHSNPFPVYGICIQAYINPALEQVSYCVPFC